MELLIKLAALSLCVSAVTALLKKSDEALSLLLLLAAVLVGCAMLLPALSELFDFCERALSLMDLPLTLFVPVVKVTAIALVALTALRFGQRGSGERILKITIPENLDYEGLFDDLFDQYTKDHTLVKVKTSNMGTLYELEYRVTLRSDSVPKAFLDALRCRNGNLNITCGREATKDAL